MNLRKFIRETLNEASKDRGIEWSKKYANAVIYSAVMIEDTTEIQKISELAQQYIPEGWVQSNNYHMTIAQGILPGSLRMRGDLNSEVELTINMIGISDRAIAFAVSGYYSTNEIPHITIAFVSGAAPEESNHIESWKSIDQVKVTGFVREIGVGNKILKEEALDNNVRLDFDEMNIVVGDKVVGDFYFHTRRDGKYLTLNKIEIYPEYARKGYATQAMNQIIDYANSKNLIIILTPEAYKEGRMSTNKLKEWYKSFGFIMNKGKNKDFQHMHLMYKLPSISEFYLRNKTVNTSPSREAHAGIPAEFPKANDFDQFGNRLNDLAV